MKGLNAMETIEILGVPFLNITQQDFLHLLDSCVEQKQKTFVVTANPEVVMKANESEEVMGYIKKATYICADGIGIVKASKLLGKPIKERVTGYDTMMGLLEVSNKKHYKIYLLGAKKETLLKAVENIRRDFPNIEIVGFHDGYFDWHHNQIAEEIVKLQPDFVFVALGVPRQEKWIAENIDQFSYGVYIGVGGSIDVIAGEVKRAPEFWQKVHLEWFYRLLKQPSRFRRMLSIPRFMMKVFQVKMKSKQDA